MGIMSLIKGQKEKFRQLQTDRSMAHNVAAADELQALKEKRLKVEGKAKLATAQADERARIGKGQAAIREHSKGARLARGLAKVMNKGKEQMKKAGESSGLQFGGSGINAFGGSGGPGFNAGAGSSPFSPQKKEEKKKYITVKVQR